jgi:hypothetical protein
MIGSKRGPDERSDIRSLFSSRMSLPPSLFELRRTSRSCGILAATVARRGQHSRSFVQVRRRSACRRQPGMQRASDHRRRRSDRHPLCADCPAHRTGSPLSPTRLEFQPASLEPTMCLINVQGPKIETDLPKRTSFHPPFVLP